MPGVLREVSGHELGAFPSGSASQSVMFIALLLSSLYYVVITNAYNFPSHNSFLTFVRKWIISNVLVSASTMSSTQ